MLGLKLYCSERKNFSLRPNFGLKLTFQRKSKVTPTVYTQMLYELQAKWSQDFLQMPGLCQLFPVVFLTTQYLSPLLVLGFTVERYISVCHPFQRHRFCTTRRALATVAALTALSLCLHSVHAYFWTFDPSPSTPTSGPSTPCSRSAWCDRS